MSVVTFLLITTRSINIADAVDSLAVVLSCALQVRILADSLVLQHKAQVGGGTVVGPQSVSHTRLSVVEIVHYSVPLLEILYNLGVGVSGIFTGTLFPLVLF